MLFKLSNLNSHLALTLGYLNPALNNSALSGDEDSDDDCVAHSYIPFTGRPYEPEATQTKKETNLEISQSQVEI